MSRLRKRAGKLRREPFGKAGLSVAILALVMAMVGGAYAAGGLTKAQEKQVTKIAKKYAGKPGAPGAAGTNGTNGTPGANGKDGTNGTPGSSVAVTSIAAGDATKCEELGGAEIKQEGAASGVAVCNGDEGEPGEDGAIQPGEKLPPGATETGAWAFTGTDADTQMLAPISFTIPLGMQTTEQHLHYTSDSDFGQFCATGGNAPIEPTAKPGELCVYYNPYGGAPTNATFQFIAPPHTLEEEGADEAGAILVFEFTGAAGETAIGNGTWAVTGCDSAPGPYQCP